MVEKFTVFASVALAVMFVVWAFSLIKAKSISKFASLFALLDEKKWKIGVNPFFGGGLLPIMNGVHANRRIKIAVAPFGTNRLIIRSSPSSVPKKVPALSFRTEWPKITNNCRLVGTEVVCDWNFLSLQDRSISTGEAKTVLNELLEACNSIESGNYKL